MKNLFVILLILGGGFLFFHDKQQTAHLEAMQADLDKAQADNAELGQQLASKQAALNALQVRMQQMIGQVSAAAPIPMSPPGQRQASPPASWNSNGSQVLNPLDQPAYRDGRR